MSNASYAPGATQAVRFLLLAESCPGLLPRLMQPFARRDLVPDHLSSVRTEDGLRVEITMDTMPAELVHLVEGNLRQVVGVHSLARTSGQPVAIAA